MGDLDDRASEYRAALAERDAAKVAARQAVAAAEARLAATRERLAAALVADARRGVRMRDLVAATGLTREWIRQILRAHGVGPDD